MTEKDDGQLVGSFPIMPKQIRAQKKRQALLKSGSILFVEKGYDNTTAKDIAQHAGVATGTFYRYFSDKRQLLMSLLEDKLDSLMPPEPNWINIDPEFFLATLLENHFDKLNRQGLHKVLPELIHRDQELAEVLSETKRKIHRRIFHGLKQAKALGYTWEDLDLETVSWTIMSLLEKIPEMNHESSQRLNYGDISKVICRLVFPPEKLKVLKNLQNDDLKTKNDMNRK
jgi:TetR/AcrR family transcriptional regulator, mexJK operon transcriptional repressor